MSDNSKIEWTTHTFNPWWGCSRVSPGCRFCYADRDATRYGHQVWRRKGPRRPLSEANWQRPARWNRDAERAGIPAKVFCASMADVFEDHPDVSDDRERLWDVIEATPWLTWQLLTKRPENVRQMVPWCTDWPGNVWLGTSVENQRFADQRIPVLESIPASVRFLSCEPLLGAVDAERFLWDGDRDERGAISWVIVGGESGPRARPCELGWLRDIVSQCRDAGTPVFVKQLGSVLGREMGAGPKGGDMSAWPEDLRIRQFPTVSPSVQVA